TGADGCVCPCLKWGLEEGSYRGFSYPCERVLTVHRITVTCSELIQKQLEYFKVIRQGSFLIILPLEPNPPRDTINRLPKNGIILRCSMSLPITENFHDLFTRPLLCAVTTINPNGQPHTVPVWCDFDGEHVRFNSPAATKKARNLKTNKKVSLFIL